MLGRRGFITGLISLVAAPAIVRASSLMPVNAALIENKYAPFFTLNDDVERILVLRFERLSMDHAEIISQQLADFIFAQGSQWPNEPGLHRLLTA